MKHPICKVEEIPAEGTRIFPFFGREVHVYRVDGKPKVVANTCLHFGGPLECRDGRFVCPWHGAEYALSDGRRLKAPPRADAVLMFLSTRVEDGVLYYVWGG